MQSRSVFLLPVGAVLISCVAIIYPALLANYGKAIVPLLVLSCFL